MTAVTAESRGRGRAATARRSQWMLTGVAAVYGLLGGVLMAVGEVRPGVLTVTFGLWLLYLKDDPELGFALSLIMLGIDIGVLNWAKWPVITTLPTAQAAVLVAKAALMIVLILLYSTHRITMRRHRRS